MQKLEDFLFHSTRLENARLNRHQSHPQNEPSNLNCQIFNQIFFFKKCVNIKFEIEIHNLTNLKTLPPSSIWSITLCTCPSRAEGGSEGANQGEAEFK